MLISFFSICVLCGVVMASAVSVSVSVPMSVSAPVPVPSPAASAVRTGHDTFIFVPGVSERGREIVREMDRRHHFERTKITMELPAIASASDTAGEGLQLQQPTQATLFSELHDPAGDEEIRKRLEEQRARFDSKLQLSMQVRLMEQQSHHEFKTPSARFLKHIESGVPEVYGWTEQFQCPPPKYLRDMRQTFDKTMTRAESRRRLLGESTYTSKSSIRASRAKLNRTEPAMSTATSNNASTSVSQSVSFAILPAHQLPLDTAASAATLDSTSSDGPSHTADSPHLEYKSGHGYLTGSQTARQLVPPAHTGISIDGTQSIQLLPGVDHSEIEPDVPELQLHPTQTPQPPTRDSASPPMVGSSTLRWGGATSRMSKDDTQLVPAAVAAPPAHKAHSLVSLPDAVDSGFLRSVLSISASNVDSRPPNFYSPASHITRPFVASTFGYTEREVTKQTDHDNDKTGPYAQTITYQTLEQYKNKHISTPQFRQSSSAKPRATPIGTKIESAIYAIDRHALNLDTFRKSTLQPLASSDVVGRSHAVDVQGHGFNLHTALGGLLGGGGLAAAGFGPDALTLRATHAPRKVDVGPGAYFITGAFAGNSNHVTTPAYGPTGLQEADARHTYITNLLNPDNPAPWKYEPRKKHTIIGTPDMSVMSSRTPLSMAGAPASLPGAPVAGESPPAPGAYTLRQFPDEPPSAQISIAHSQFGFTPRFSVEQRKQKESHTVELARLIEDRHFKGKERTRTRTNKRNATTKASTDEKEDNRNTNSTNPSPVIVDSPPPDFSSPRSPPVPRRSSLIVPPPPPPAVAVDPSIDSPPPEPAPPSPPPHHQPSATLTMTALKDMPPHILAQQMAVFGTIQPTPQFLAAQAALHASRQAAIESTKFRPVQSSLPPLIAQPPLSTNGSASNPAVYAKSLGQFSFRARRAARAAAKAERDARMDDVLTAHREIVHKKLGITQSKIARSNAALHARMSRRQLNSRWFEILALTSRLNLWRQILATRRVFLFINQKRDHAARAIQRVWRAHQWRIKDARRQLSLRILKRNFKVLFFRRRVKRRIHARTVLLSFFRDVLKFHDHDESGAGAAAVAAADALQDPFAPAVESDSRVASGGGYRRGTVTSVTAVIRHFKTQIKTIQRAVRRYFLLRDAQLHALCLLWDQVYDRQRKLFNDYSRRYKMMDAHALADHAAREHAKLVHQQQQLIHRIDAQQRAAEAAAAAAIADSTPSTPNTDRTVRLIGGSTGLGASRRSRAPSPLLDARRISHKGVLRSGSASIASLPTTPNHDRNGSIDATPLMSDQQATEADGFVPNELPTAMRAERTNNDTNSLSLPPVAPSAARHKTISPHAAPRRVVSGAGVVAPPPVASSSSSHHAPFNAASIVPPIPAFPQIFQWDRKFTDAEKRQLLLNDWKERRMRFAQVKSNYLAQEESFIKDECRGLTAAKRLLRESSVTSSGSLVSGGVMTRSVAQMKFRESHPYPVFRGLMSAQAMVKFINATLCAGQHQRRRRMSMHAMHAIHINTQAQQNKNEGETNEKTHRRRQ